MCGALTEHGLGGTREHETLDLVLLTRLEHGGQSVHDRLGHLLLVGPSATRHGLRRRVDDERTVRDRAAEQVKCERK